MTAGPALVPLYRVTVLYDALEAVYRSALSRDGT